MRIIELKKENLTLKDKIEGFLERTVSPLGNSGKVDCPKRFIGRRVYILIAQDEHRKKSSRIRAKTGRSSKRIEELEKENKILKKSMSFDKRKVMKDTEAYSERIDKSNLSIQKNVNIAEKN
jgi:putative transposon-encoded protein